MEHNENLGHLKSYFEKASEEQPVVSITEVSQLITAIPAGIVSASLTSKAVQHILAQYKYWLGGGLSVCTGALLLFNLPGKEAKNVSANNSSIVAPSNKALEQDVTSNASVVDEKNITINSENKFAGKESSPKEIVETANIPSSTKPVKASGASKASYYFPGAANVDFELDGDKVNMTIGEKVEKLEINGVQIDKSEYSKYEAVIENGMKLKSEYDASKVDNNDASNRKQNKNREIMNGLIEQLKADQLMDESGHFEFRITSLKVFIDKKEQNESITRKYIKMYETVSGNRLTINSNIRIEH